MVGTGAVLRAAKLIGPGKVRVAAAHNQRAIQAELGSRSHIDTRRIALNVHLAGPTNPSAVAQYSEDRMKAAGVGKLRKDAVRAIEFVVSLPVGADVDEDAFFKDAMLWLAARCGGEDNILSADIHRDEAAPHMHLLILPLIGGRMVGSATVGGPSNLRDLQDGFFRDVCEPHGLERYPRRLSGARKKEATAAVMSALEKRSDPSLKSILWTLIRDRIATDPGPFAELLGVSAPAAKPKRQRTMTEIFTSPGKGPKREHEAKNHIGFSSHSANALEVEPYAL